MTFELVPGWQRLDKDESDQIWRAFDERFLFRPSTRAKGRPAIVEPVPSLTWDLAISRHDLEERVQAGVERFAANEDDVNRLVIGALRDCLPEDGWVYVLDWQHPTYRCWPHRFDPYVRREVWPTGAFPDGDYYSFVSPDLSFGTFGHPWETTLCVWGVDLIEAVETRNRDVLKQLHRRDGHPVDRPR
ncbi:DUF2716 domain-containing protein [Actinophytocola sp.]|uniref:DUF2716 domain-containing protein n=1 Tax=Actinophytocola sp. TaxID=1872138 RepID=UPI002ED55CE2